MEESVTYQEIVSKGRAEEARALILRLGSKRFGGPDARIQKKLDATRSVKQLERWADRLLEAESWEELLK